jgi:hypothetical protein
MELKVQNTPRILPHRFSDLSDVNEIQKQYIPNIEELVMPVQPVLLLLHVYALCMYGNLEHLKLLLDTFLAYLAFSGNEHHKPRESIPFERGPHIDEIGHRRAPESEHQMAKDTVSARPFDETRMCQRKVSSKWCRSSGISLNGAISSACR